MTLNSSIVFGPITIDGSDSGNVVEDYDPYYVLGSLKSVQNGIVSVQEIPGRTQEWQIEISGFLSSSTMEADKSEIESRYLNGTITGLLDGEHDGNYVITSLRFPRKNFQPTIRRYTMTIRQYTQTLP